MYEACGRGYAECTSLAVSDERHRRSEIAEEDRNMAGDEIVDRLRGAFVGNMRHFHAGHRLEQFGVKMRWTANAARSERELARSVLGQLDQPVGHAAHRGNDDDHVVARLLRGDDTLGDIEDSFGIADGRAAVFLHDEQGGRTLQYAARRRQVLVNLR